MDLVDEPSAVIVSFVPPNAEPVATSVRLRSNDAMTSGGHHRSRVTSSLALRCSGMHRLFLGLLGLLLLLPAAASAQAPSTARATPLAQHDGTVLLSRWDGAAYRLAVLRSGTIADLPGVLAQAEPFDADLGPDTSGATTAVYSAGGDLFTVGLRGGDPRPVTAVNTAGDEHAPSLWGGRLAFARGDRTYVRSSKGTVRLPGLPAKRCTSVLRNPCQPIEGVAVDELELVRDDVVQSWTYRVDGAGGFGQHELRLVKATGKGGARQLRYMTSGEGGQRFIGLSIAGGQVAWYQTCFGDPGGCTTTGGAYRSSLKTGRYQRAQDATALGGWAWDGRVAWRSFAGETSGCQGDLPVASPSCPITNDQPAWKAMRAPKPVR